MKGPRIKSAVSWALMMLALVAILLWQQTSIARLKAEVQTLRREAALAVSSRDPRHETTNPQAEPRRPLNSQPQASSNPGRTEDQFRELLRLRGLVGVLKGELAEAVKGGSRDGASGLAPSVEEPSKPTQEWVEETELTAAIAQERAATAEQVVGVLATALNVPQSAARIEGVDLVDALKDPSLASYQLYLRFKLECFQLRAHADAEKARADGARAASQTSRAPNSAP